MTEKFMKINVGPIVSTIAMGCLLFGLPSLPASARNHLSSNSQIVPESWVPSLDQVAEALEESAKADTQISQQALNRTSQNLADIRDAQLFIAYLRLMQTLDTRGQAHLFKEQTHWLNQRKEKARASIVSKGGSLEALEYNDAFRQMTEERLTELKARLQKRLNSK
jgi:uncharacterized protein YecT (DUF1311 family)